MGKLREIRKSRGITMKQLGERVGVTESAIQMYETGKRKPSYEMLLRLSEALGVSVDDIMDEKKPAPKGELESVGNDVLDLSKIDEDRRKIILGVLQMTEQQKSAALPMIEYLISHE